MAVDIKVPSVGESITEGRISRWMVADGGTVQVDQPVCELETDKATAEIAAPASGVVKHGAKEGDIVSIGAVIGQIEASSGATAKAAPAPQKAAPATAATAATSESKETTLSPAARRAAEEEGVDPSKINGTGRDGRIIKEDVYAAKQAPAEAKPAASPAPTKSAPASVPSGERETRLKMTGIRQRIAQRLLESQQTTATLTTFNETDLSAIMALREKYKDKFKEKHGVGLGFMSFFVKATIAALKAFPTVNSRIEGAEVVQANYYDIGVAVSTERGLMVPVIRNTDQMSMAAIEKKIAEMAVKARDGKISVDDLQGGTFTITNGGVFGSLLSTPILNPPQSAILGMHTIQKRPVVVNDQIVIRPMMYLALSYDHRLIDGREAVQFLVRIKEGVENPERLMLEI